MTIVLLLCLPFGLLIIAGAVSHFAAKSGGETASNDKSPGLPCLNQMQIKQESLSSRSVAINRRATYRRVFGRIQAPGRGDLSGISSFSGVGQTPDPLNDPGSQPLGVSPVRGADICAPESFPGDGSAHSTYGNDYVLPRPMLARNAVAGSSLSVPSTPQRAAEALKPQKDLRAGPVQYNPLMRNGCGDALLPESNEYSPGALISAPSPSTRFCQMPGSDPRPSTRDQHETRRRILRAIISQMASEGRCG